MAYTILPVEYSDKSEYPNHSYLKRQRILVFQRTKGRCEICDGFAVETHHIDEDKSNHELDNLLAVCKRCHGSLHHGARPRRDGNARGMTSKTKRTFGYTATEIADMIGCSTTWLYSKIRAGDEEEIKNLIQSSKTLA